VAWKPRLANYKSHIKKKLKMCCIARYFMEECTDSTLQNLKFVIVDVVNNVDQLNKDDIDS